MSGEREAMTRYYDAIALLGEARTSLAYACPACGHLCGGEDDGRIESADVAVDIAAEEYSAAINARIAEQSKLEEGSDA
jgi:hypothetical protein